MDRSGGFRIGPAALQTLRSDSPAPEVRARARTAKCASIPVPPSALAGFPFRLVPKDEAPAVSDRIRRLPEQTAKLSNLLRLLAQASAVVGSSLTPGPIVELIETLLMKVPLAPLGLARLMAFTSAFTLAAMASSLNEALPTPA